jgi:hypothetical protein
MSAQPAEHSLTVVQYNLRKQQEVQELFLSLLDPQDHHIVAVQEPHQNKHNDNIKNARGYHTVVMVTKCTRTCFYVSRHIPQQHWNVVFHGPDMCTLRLSLPSLQTPLSIHNVYNPCPQLQDDANQCILPSLEQRLQEPGEHMVVGDFNLHHPNWGGVGVARSPQAYELIRIMEANGLSLALPPGTRTRVLGEQRTTIDLVLTSPGITRRTLECHIKESLHTNSDHRPIVTLLDISVSLPRCRRKQFKKANWPAMNEYLGTELPQALGNLSSTSEIDQAFEHITKTIKDAVELHVPWSSPTKYSRPEWSPECTVLVRESKQCRKAYDRDPTEEHRVAYRRAQRQLKKQLHKNRTHLWRNHVDKASRQPDKLWALARWARTKAGKPPDLPQLPAIKVPGGDTTADNELKAKALAERFFPPPLPVDLSDIPEAAYGDPINVAQEVTEDEILNAVARVAPDKAPGPDAIPNRLLKECGKALAPTLRRVFTACLRLSYHPRCCKQSITVVLRKEGKPDYSEPGAYRPIALLNTIGKTLEGIVAERMTKAAEDFQLLPPTQMGARAKRSTMSALAHLTEYIHTLWDVNRKIIVTMLSLDLTGAYDRVSHERLLHRLRKLRLPEWLVKFIQSFLTQRMTRLSFGGFRSQPIPTPTGIPQGSRLSPILFLLFASELLEVIKGPRTSGFGFVDDTNVVTYSESTATNCRAIERCHEACLGWARRHGAAFAPDKYHLIHFTRRRNVDLKAKPRIEGMTRDPETSLRVLGVWVDSKLKWGPQVRKAEEKGLAQLKAMQRITASTWGTTFRKARLLYTAIIRPTLTHGCRVWGAGENGKPLAAKHIKSLEKVQNQCLRAITGGYKRTPARILEREADIPPIAEYIKTTALTQAHKAIQQPVTNMTKQATYQLRQATKPRRGRPPRVNPTPQTRLEGKARQIVDKASNVVHAEHRERLKHFQEQQQQGRWRRREPPRPPNPTAKSLLRQWQDKEWENRWNKHRESVPTGQRSAPPAYRTPWRDRVPAMHTSLNKAQSTVATLLRTRVIGLNDWLYMVGVPGIDSPACPCGWQRQTPEHIVTACSLHEVGRDRLWQQARTDCYNDLLQDGKRLVLVTRWFIQRRILQQFSIAADMAESQGEGPPGRQPEARESTADAEW